MSQKRKPAAKTIKGPAASPTACHPLYKLQRPDALAGLLARTGEDRSTGELGYATRLDFLGVEARLHPSAAH